MTSDITYPRKWCWPNGETIAMSVGLAFEAFSHHSQFNTLGSARAGAGKANALSLSYADYGWKAGVWRILDVMERYGLKGNMSISGQANQPAMSELELARRIADCDGELFLDNAVGASRCDNSYAQKRVYWRKRILRASRNQGGERRLLCMIRRL